MRAVGASAFYRTLQTVKQSADSLKDLLIMLRKVLAGLQLVRMTMRVCMAMMVVVVIGSRHGGVASLSVCKEVADEQRSH